MNADDPNQTGEHAARVQYFDGHVEEVSNVEPAIFEWLFEELHTEKDEHTLYLPRTDGATALSRRGGISRIDVIRVGPKP